MNIQNESNLPINRLIQITIQQHDGFRFQIGSLIDILHSMKLQTPTMQKIKNNLHEVYILTHQITKLLQNTSQSTDNKIENIDNQIEKQKIRNFSPPNHSTKIIQNENPSSSTQIDKQPKQEIIKKQIDSFLDCNDQQQSPYFDDYLDFKLEYSSSFMNQNSFFEEKFIQNKSFVKEEVLSRYDSLILEKNENSYFQFQLEIDPKENTEKQEYLLTENQLNKRGKYNICTLDRKMEAIRIAKIKNIKEASDILEIPQKNIKRWIQNGPERKKGAGRKTMDPVMERCLQSWVSQYFKKTKKIPENKQIKDQAKEFSTFKEFKASKGWCDKFLKRNHQFFQMLQNDSQNIQVIIQELNKTFQIKGINSTPVFSN